MCRDIASPTGFEPVLPPDFSGWSKTMKLQRFLGKSRTFGSGCRSRNIPPKPASRTAEVKPFHLNISSESEEEDTSWRPDLYRSSTCGSNRGGA